jgi:nucleoside-diphosphate-sugar epimerase
MSIRGEGMAENIGSREKYSVREATAIAEHLFGITKKIIEDSSRMRNISRFSFDPNKVRKELDWYPK